MDDDTEHKKAKRTKNRVMKKDLMFKSYTDCLLKNKIILNRNKVLKVIIAMYALNKSMRLH